MQKADKVNGELNWFVDVSHLYYYFAVFFHCVLFGYLDQAAGSSLSSGAEMDEPHEPLTNSQQVIGFKHDAIVKLLNRLLLIR